MKRLWLGLCILAVLLALSAGTAAAVERIHSPIAAQLKQAALAADAENWSEAETLVHSAESRWEQYHAFTAAVADHTPMDELDGLFAELAVYLQTREQPHFSATCRHLAQLAQAMADSHLPTWWNLL